jgi:hypothetical protein
MAALRSMTSEMAIDIRFGRPSIQAHSDGPPTAAHPIAGVTRFLAPLNVCLMQA